MFELATIFFEKWCETMVGCYERGKRDNLGHGQMGCTVRMALDAQGLAEFKKHFKKHLGILPGEDF